MIEYERINIKQILSKDDFAKYVEAKTIQHQTKKLNNYSNIVWAKPFNLDH